MKISVSALMVLACVLCTTAQEKPRERINVYLSGARNDNATEASSNHRCAFFLLIAVLMLLQWQGWIRP
jgi:hypothetical protein